MIRNLLKKLLFKERYDNSLEPRVENEFDGILNDLDYLEGKANDTAYLPVQEEYITIRAKNIRETLYKNNENLVNNVIAEKDSKIDDLEARLYFIEKVAANILASKESKEIKLHCEDIFRLCDLKTKFMVDGDNNLIFYDKEDLLK